MGKTKSPQIQNEALVKSVRKTQSKGIEKHSYSDETLKAALNELGKGASYRAIAEKFNVPTTTLFNKSKHYTAIDCKKGPETVLSENEESRISQWLKYRAERGFPVTKLILLDCVQKYLDDSNKETIFKDNRPGNKWWKAFLKRHPDLSLRISQSLTSSRAGIEQDRYNDWHQRTRQNLMARGILHENPDDDNPDQFWNGDESAVRLNPPSDLVVVEKGSKSVYNLIGTNEKECVTVLITASASGKRAPSYVLFPGETLPSKAVLQKMPKGWSFGLSANGWMDAASYFSYVANKFVPYLKAEKIPLPVALFVDNHSSHVTLALAEFCQKNGVELSPLYPNCTHFAQPLDVSLFKPLKAKYKEELLKYRIANEIIQVQKYHVPIVLELALNAIDFEGILKSGFEKCGLFPFKKEAIETNILLRCKKRTNETQTELTSPSNEPEKMNESANEVDLCLNLFQKLYLTEEMVHDFECASEGLIDKEPQGMDREDLFDIWCEMKRLSAANRVALQASPCSVETNDQPTQEDLMEFSQNLSENYTSHGSDSEHEVVYDLPIPVEQVVSTQNDNDTPGRVELENLPVFIDHVDITNFGRNNDEISSENASLDSSTNTSAHDFFMDQDRHASSTDLLSNDTADGSANFELDLVQEQIIPEVYEQSELSEIGNPGQARNMLQQTETREHVLEDIQNTMMDTSQNPSASNSTISSDASSSAEASPKASEIFDKVFHYPKADLRKKKDPKIPAAAGLSDLITYLGAKEEDKKLRQEEIKRRKEERQQKKENRERSAEIARAHAAEKKELVHRKKGLNAQVKELTKKIKEAQDEETKNSLSSELTGIIGDIDEINKILTQIQKNQMLSKLQLKEN